MQKREERGGGERQRERQTHKQKKRQRETETLRDRKREHYLACGAHVEVRGQLPGIQFSPSTCGLQGLNFIHWVS